jgi:lysozyme
MANRIKVAGLSLSAVAFITLIVSEGFSPTATVPVKGDRPTVGFGSTYHQDGSAVKMGETISPVKGLQTAQAHISKDEVRFRQSLLSAELTQAEYDLYIDWVYQYGIGRWLASPMRQRLIDGEYRQACDALLLPQYRTVAGYDCSTAGNKRCYGGWVRAQSRHRRCIDSLH